MKKVLLVLLFASVGPPLLVGDDHNPIGVTGAFEGVTTTASAYNVLNHSAARQIDDIVVPGAIGKYGLKMTRYHNSRGIGDGWSREYEWGSHNGKVSYPNGNVWNNHCTDFWGLSEGPLGVSDWPTTWNGFPAFRLADGGTIVFGSTQWSYRATKIIDPYGQETNITLGGAYGLVTRVTEPGGRYLQFTYDGSYLLTQVDAYDGRGNRVDYVVYHYSAIKPKNNGTQGTAVNCLTSVDYSDGTHAYYTYQDDNSPENPSPPCPCPMKVYPVLKTCKDVRYKGPMRNICYVYQDPGPHGAILREKYWDGISGHENNGPMVSRIDPPAPSPLLQVVTFPTTYTEYRGDGPTRTFNYTALSVSRPATEDECPTINGPAPQQFPTDYTDFRGNSTHLGYDPNWYVNSVRDANMQTTSYVRGSPPPAGGIGEILTITYPGGSHIDYTYYDHGHYLHTVSNERQKVTTYTRDPNTHLVTRIDYPQDANTPASSEVFTYNGFGQVLTHQLKNGAWESFVYDNNNRGLLTDKYNPKATLPSGGDPHTHYTYYAANDPIGGNDWIDRVKTVTLPANVSGFQASDTYEYDKNAGGTHVPGRGLVTKITNADGTYQSLGYDAYGNKLWEENELRKRTSYTYDEFNRVLTIKDPIGQTTGRATTYTYSASPYLQTTNNPDTVTTPAGIVTSNVYDENFRKTSSTVAGQATWFHYDNVGNQDWVTDPRGTAGRTWPNADPAYTTYFDYDSRNRKWRIREPLGRTTQLFYEDGINLTRINRPDGTNEWKTYDALNRMIWDTVMQTNSITLSTYFNYNPSGTLGWMSDPNEHYTSFWYDASDQKIEMIYHDGSSIQWWGYDDAHNLKYRITVNGEVQHFSYDIRNRKTGMTWSNNADSATYGYDDVGRLTSAGNPNSTVTRQYDDAGRLTLDRQNITGFGIKSVNYPTYDDDGKLMRVNVSNVPDYDYTFSYDAMGRFEKIFITNSVQLFQYHYDPASNETQRDNTYINGIRQVYPRDALNRMQYVDVMNGNNTLGHEGYTYDPMNRITLVDYGNGHTDSFVYYLDGELNQAQLGNFNRTVTYTLDKAGNRQTVVDNNTTTTYTPNTLNQYSAVSGNAIANGNEHEISNFNKVTYTYINDEHLKQISDGTNTYTLAYDALGRCVKRTLTINSTSNTNTTAYYVYNGEKPILEVWSGVIAKNLYGKGIDEILMRTDQSVNGGAAFYYQHDHEGSVTHLTNAAGNVIEKYRYDAFGAPTFYNGSGTQISSTAYNNRFLFTGREYAATFQGNYIPSFKFYEYRARAYSPALGRFMSEDPKLFDAGDYNLFRYCHNDPIDFTDPMGLDDQPLPAGPNHASPLMELSKRQMQFDRSNGAVATAFNAVKDFITATDKMTGGPEYRAATRNYIQWTENNRAMLPPWAQNILQFIDDTSGVGMGVPVGGVKPVVQFTKVFRVWGDGSKPWGPSWTPVDPRTVPNYRNAAGLPNKNSGRFLSEGTLRNTEGVREREALPLHGGDGGLRELTIPHAEQQVQLQNVQGVNPPF